MTREGNWEWEQWKRSAYGQTRYENTTPYLYLSATFYNCIILKTVTSKICSDETYKFINNLFKILNLSLYISLEGE